MQGHNPNFQGQYRAVAQPSATYHDHGSPSGSDDDNAYLSYPEPHRMELGVDDENAALTSQTLNADGTPKRPMNAFMIFARRRRPQVAAENQSMRTGDVSKILSREWNAMSLSEKQFYLDQAKLLKDNFNHKYPDYVYKRRPNNSRRRRKHDPTPGPSTEYASGSDLVEDFSGSTEWSDVSSVDIVDTDDPHGQDVRYSDQSVDPYLATPSRAPNYQPSDPSYRPLNDPQVSYTSRPSHATPDTGMGSSVSSAARGSEHANYYHPYMSAQQQHHSQTSSYIPESGSTGEPWLGARADQGRMHVQSWSQDSHDLGTDDRQRGYPASVQSHAWTHTSPPAGMSSASSSGKSTVGYNFPTLNSPFYPPGSSAQEGFSSSSVQPISVSSQHFSTVGSTPGNPVSGRSYSSLQQAYSSSVIGSYQSQARTVSLSTTSGQPAATSYPQAQPTNPPPAGSGGNSSQTQYWPRER